ncbi:hypothetical protein JSO19_08780 [Leucobacter sp. UCMA 4100]|uniref:hypothetical protein n=1 Tax=Leucobacter sp. UCMA 4100 TaxID=2810534 RepID=UPI0022EA8FD6|nr:hypothetical protein [Leucobacter sp. UCMA 4100]MDA3147474.1 hypothetical protein [Leucobacter sp. UCMA 4100]
MESKDGRAPVTSGDSTAAKQQLDQFTALNGSVRPDPGYWFLMLCGAVMAAGYIAVFMLTVRASFTAHPGAQPALLVMPIIVFTALAVGARERFGVRTRVDVKRTTIVVCAAIVVFVLVYLVAMRQGDHGDFVANLLVPFAVFGALSFEPIMALLRERSYRDATEGQPRGRKGRRAYLSPQRLSAPVKRNTVLIGVIFAALLASSPFTMVAAYVHFAVMAIVMVMMLMMFISQHSPGNIARVGYEWGEAQWSVFSVAVASNFVAAIMVQYGHVLFDPATVMVVDIVLAALTLMLFVVATLLPGARRP